MSVNFNKNGNISLQSINEPLGFDLMYGSQKSFTFTPSTAQNSCLQGWLVDFTGRKPGEKFYVELDVEYSGFEKTTSAGTFNMWFQGARFKVSDSSLVWETDGSGITHCFENIANALASTVTSSTSGFVKLKGSFNLASSFPNTYSKQYLGLRSDYSNGIGTVKLSNLKVIPELYYLQPSLGSTKITKSGIVITDNIIEY